MMFDKDVFHIKILMSFFVLKLFIKPEQFTGILYKKILIHTFD